MIDRRGRGNSDLFWGIQYKYWEKWCTRVHAEGDGSGQLGPGGILRDQYHGWDSNEGVGGFPIPCGRRAELETQGSVHIVPVFNPLYS